MNFGICCAPTSLALENEPLQVSVERLVEVLSQAKADYMEFPVAALHVEGQASAFEELRRALEGAPLQVEAFNGFIPGHHRVTGPEIDHAKVLEFCDVALERINALGGEVVVLGSGKARNVPEGFSHAKALEQFTEFCHDLAPLAQKHNVTVVIEPLNTREDNLINTVAQGSTVVDEVWHPNLQVLADFYHIFVDDEPLQNTVNAGTRLQHTHLADTGRITAGMAAEEADFIGFFRALQGAGYTERARPRCSFEGHMENIAAQVGPMFAFLRERYAQSLGNA